MKKIKSAEEHDPAALAQRLVMALDDLEHLDQSIFGAADAEQRLKSLDANSERLAQVIRDVERAARALWLNAQLSFPAVQTPALRALAEDGSAFGAAAPEIDRRWVVPLGLECRALIQAAEAMATETQPLVDDDSYLWPAKLSEIFQVALGPLQSRLNRWRNQNDAGWMENPDRTHGQAKYLYRVGAVRHIIENKKRPVND